MNQPANGFESQLRTLYDQEHIGVGHFACKFRGSCEKAAGKSVLSRGSEAYIGARYGSVMRIAIVSPDSLGSSADVTSRRESAENWSDNGNASHLNEILHLVRKLVAKEVSGQPPHHYFAMIDSAKCSSPVVGAPESLHSACRHFALAELVALDPDLVVTMGERTQRVLADFPARDVDVNGLLASANAVADSPVFDFLTLDWLTTVSARYLSGLRIGNRNAFALHAPHPSDPAWEQFSQLHLPICSWLVRELVSRQAKR